MSKTKLEFSYRDTDFCLEYTADSLKKLEKSGFSFGNITDHLLSATEELFYGAFLANHPSAPRKLREEIYQELSESADDSNDALAEVLFEMIKEAMEALTPKGNLQWRVKRA